MPPERTTQSFLEYANAPGLYSLSSTGPGSAASLERGRACLVCRTRKVKCDGVKPACGACCRSARAHGEDPTKITCDFAEPARRRRKVTNSIKDQPEQSSDNSSSTEVDELKQRIVELEAQLSRQMEQSLPGLPSLPNSNAVSPSGGSAATASSVAPIDLFVNNRSNLDPFHQAQQSLLSFQEPDKPPEMLLSGAAYNRATGPFAFPMQNFFGSSLFITGWPQDLPSIGLIDRLLDVYFSRDHIMSNVIDPGRFRARMSLPPTHANFPLDILIHAILGFTANLVAPSFFDYEPRYWGLDESFSDYHINRANRMYQETPVSNQSRKMMDLCQAIIILSSHNYVQANFGKVWFQLASGNRLAVFLGLNHVRRAVRDPDGVLRNNGRKLEMNMLPPTDDPEELYERQMTFYAAFISDRIASVSSTKEPIVDLADITTLIPSLEGPTCRLPYGEELITSPLSHHNPNFFIAHPANSCGSFQLGLKALLLTGQAQDFVSRAPEPIGTGLSKPLSPYEDGPPDIRRTAGFRRIESNIKQFAASLPREYTAENAVSNPNGYVGTILMVITMPHVAMLILHERFCAINSTDHSMVICVEEARQVLTIVYMLFNTSFDIARVNPFLNSMWLIVGRTLVREIALKQLRQDFSATEIIANDVRLLTAAMRATQCKLGESTAKTLTAMLANPRQCLPEISDPRVDVVCHPDEVLIPQEQVPSFTRRTNTSFPDPFFPPLESSAEISPIETDGDRFQNLSPETSSSGPGGSAPASVAGFSSSSSRPPKTGLYPL